MKRNKFDGVYSMCVSFKCISCKHFYGKNEGGIPTCRAYQKEIPEKLWMNEFCIGNDGYLFEEIMNDSIDDNYLELIEED